MGYLTFTRFSTGKKKFEPIFDEAVLLFWKKKLLKSVSCKTRENLYLECCAFPFNNS